MIRWSEIRASFLPMILLLGGCTSQLPPRNDRIVWRTRVLEEPIWEVRFSTDGERIVTAGFDGTARVWEVANGRQQLVLKHGETVYTVDWSADGASVLSSSEYPPGQTRVWDARTGELLHTLRGAGGEFTSDGKVLTHDTFGGLQIGHVWNLQTARDENGDPFMAEAPVWHPDAVVNRLRSDSRIVTYSSRAGELRLWDSPPRKIQRRWPYSGPVWGGGILSRDGTVLIIVGPGAEPRALDLQSGAVRAFGIVHSLLMSLSPDGRTAITTDNRDPGRAVLWDTRTGLEVGQLRHRDQINAAEWSPSGRHVVTVSMDRTAIFWKIGGPE